MAEFEREGIFKGVRILDFTIALAGVFNAWQFADNGADVWKVERYGSGDQCRFWAPFVDDLSALYASFNRNKRSVEIDMRNPEGKALILEMVKHCDLVLENFKAGTMEKLGLGYDVLKEANPKIVYGSLSGFGTNGPLWKLPCYDLIASGRGGLVSCTGEPDGLPLKPSFSIGDNGTGVNFFHATNMALTYARETGKGCRFEVAMMDSCMQAADTAIVEDSITGSCVMRNGNHNRFYAPYGMYEARDGYAVFAVQTEEEWGKFCDTLGLEDLKTDARFATNADRVKNLEELIPAIEAVTVKMWKYDLEETLMAEGVPAAAVMPFADVVTSKHLKQEGSLIFLQQEGIGRLPMIGNPVHFSKTPGKIAKGAPMLGEDSIDILKSCGYDDKAIQKFIDVNAVGVYKR